MKGRCITKAVDRLALLLSEAGKLLLLRSNSSRLLNLLDAVLESDSDHVSVEGLLSLSGWAEAPRVAVCPRLHLV